MQVTVSATSSKVDDLILIETSTTIGDQVTKHRAGYNAEELLDNRFLSGDLETRIEALRVGAEAVTVRAVEAHFKTLMKVLSKEPAITEVSAMPDVLPDFVETVPVLKKPKAKRQVKPTESK